MLNELFSYKYLSAEHWTTIAPAIVAGLVISILFLVIYHVIARLLDNALEKTHLAPALRQIIVHSLVKWLVIILAAISILNQFGVNVTAALAGLGIAGIALGFAAKESLANILSGFGIFMDKLYVTGDWIEIVGERGQVKDITLRTTKIRTLDNIFITVPNAQITQNPVTNFSEEGMVRITAEVGIAYNASIDEARAVLVAAAATIHGVCADPAPTVTVKELDDSSVKLFVRMWVEDPGADASYQSTLTEVSKKALDAAGIEIPFPQRVVYNKK